MPYCVNPPSPKLVVPLTPSHPYEPSFTQIDISYLLFISLKDLESPFSMSMSQNGQGSSNQPPHHSPYNLRKTLKRKTRSRGKKRPPRNPSQNLRRKAVPLQCQVEGVVGTFIKRKLSPTVSETPASSLGTPAETSTPASSFLMELILSQSRVEAPAQDELDPRGSSVGDPALGFRIALGITGPFSQRNSKSFGEKLHVKCSMRSTHRH